MEGDVTAKGGGAVTLANKTQMDPSVTDTLLSLKTDIFRNMNCVKIGQIVSFDATKKSAKIQLLFKRVLPNNTITSYPLLVDCPVFTLQGDGGAILMPITAGDQCIVLFSDRNIDAWYKNGAEAAPLNARSHDIADGIALVGLNSLTSSLENYESGKLKIFYGDAQIVLNGGNVSIVNATGAEIDLTAAIITIKNGTTTLLTVLNGLITLLESLQVVGPISLTPASIASLEAYKLQLAVLLG